MKKLIPFKFLAALLLLLIFVLPVASQKEATQKYEAQASNDFYKVVADAGVLDSALSGVTLWHDYGAFALYKVTEGAMSNLSIAQRERIVVVDDSIKIDAYPFNTQTESIDVPINLSLTNPKGGALHLVQFVGPMKASWLDMVRATGAKPIHYINSNGYLVWANSAARAKLDILASDGDFLQFSMPYQPYFKLGQSIRERIENVDESNDKSIEATDSEIVPVTIQMYKHDGGAETEALVDKVAVERISKWAPILRYQNIIVKVHASDFVTLANRPDVVWIGERFEREMMDAAQGFIIAGSFEDDSHDGPDPAVTDYIGWLDDLGFSNDPDDYPIVDVVDDGIGNGSIVNGAGDSTLTELNDGTTTRLQYVTDCTSNGSGEGVGGHGHINVSIVGSYDNRTGLPFQDPEGFSRGVGISPYGRMAGSRIFGPSYDVSACGGNDQGLIQHSYDLGAQITSNSWGASVSGSYDDSSQAYDVGTRDANLDEAGNQEMIHIFAAGNSGSGSATVGSPGSGKNMITVGASENDRPSDEDGDWSDGCGVGPTGADNAMDVIGFSSRGPAQGDRVKPEIIAPGTHIQGTANTGPNYDGTGVCDQYHPSGQTIFAASSGTSHSTPAIAGYSSLVYYWFEHELGLPAPSSAAMKAYMMAHPTYLTGLDADDDLPSNDQGYGMPNMSVAFDNIFKQVIDQSDVFDNTGEEFSYGFNIFDSSKPVRIAMAYTDEAGAIGTAPQINDLSLSVVVGEDTYLGNNFDKDYSVTGGTADANNNYEAVFLPAGISGRIEIFVTADNIAGDGIPNVGDDTDQDFALVCYNCTLGPTGTLQGTVTDSDTGSPIDNALVEGTSISYTIRATTDVSGTYETVVPEDTYNLVARAFGYASTEVSNVAVISGAVTTQDIALSSATWYTVSGNITDDNADWPIYAKVTVEGDPESPPDNVIWTDPETGYYEISLPEGIDYALSVNSVYEGYETLPSTFYSPVVPPLTEDVVLDIALDIDAVACTAPGYEVAYTNLYGEDFEADNGGYVLSSVITSTWEWGTIVITDANPITQAHSGVNVWATNLGGKYVDNEDGYITSPDIDLSATTGAIEVSWWQYLETESCCDEGSVYVSNDGGATWTSIYSERGNVNSDWAQESILLDDTYTVSDFRIRFELTSDYSAQRPGFYLDDVSIDLADCVLQPGGLVIGNVYDVSTTSPITKGADIWNEDDYLAMTINTPEDDDVDDAFYYIFSPAGTKAFSATAEFYGTSTDVVTVTQSDTVVQDFDLDVGQLTIDPTAFQITVDAGMSATQVLNVANIGGAGAFAELDVESIGFMPAALPRVDEDILIVNDGNYNGDATASFAAALDNLGYSYAEIVSADFDDMDVEDILEYEAVLYAGIVSTGGELDKVTEYLDMGGIFLVSDNDLGYYANDLYTTYLQANYVSDSGSDGVLTGLDIMAGINPDISSDPYPDDFTIIGDDAVGIFEAPSGNYAGLRIEREGYKAVYFAWDFDHIGSGGVAEAEETDVLDAALSWLVTPESLWLSTNPITFTIAASPTVVTVDVTVDSSLPGLDQPGDYMGLITLEDDTPYDDIMIPVTMTVTPPASWGKVNGIVRGLGYCDDNPMPLEGAVVFLESDTIYSRTLETYPDGSYTLWLDEANSPLTVTVDYENHETGIATSVAVTAGMTTTVDFYLRELIPCVTVDSDVLETTLDIGETNNTKTIVLTNDGAEVADFSINNMVVDASYNHNEAGPYVAGDIIQSWAINLTLGWGIGFDKYMGDLWISNPSAGGGDDLDYRFLQDGTNTGDAIDTSAWMGSWAADMTFNVNTGMLWQLDVGGSDCIHELDPIAMEATGNTICPAWTTSQRGLAYDPTSDTYFVGGWNEDIIYHFDNSGNILEQVNVGLGISGLAYNPETQHLFVTVSDDADSSLHILDAADSFAEVDSFTADGFDSGAGLAIGCDGSLWAVDQDLQMVFQIDSGESASLCGGASGVWIAEEPATGVIPADGSIEVTVIFTALNTLELGEHYADVNISTSDPYSGSNFTESATMTVTLPSGYGQLSGDVTGLGYCDNDSYPLAGAEVTVAGMQLTTDANGHYFIYLDSSDNPYDVEAIAEGHIGETSSASIVEGDVVEVDFALRSDEPCISVAHDTMEATLEYGQSESFIMTLTNDGAGESFFEIGKYSTTPELRFLQSESTVIVSTRPDLTAIAKSDYVLSTYRDTSKHQSDTHVNKSQSDVAQKSVRSDLILTHSASQEILEANSVSCNDGTAHTDNSYFRVFDLEAFDINGDFDVTSVEFGIESAASAGSQPVTVNLYTLDDPDNFVFANLTPIGSADVDIPDQTLSIVTVPVEGTAPSGSILVVELFTPDGGTSNLFFAGSNTAGQTDYSYIAAAECGIAEPATLESIGFTMHLVMNVTGSASGGGSTDWLIPTPISGTIPADSSVDVDITFDALATLSVGSHYAMVTVDTADENLDFEAPAVLTIDCPTCGVLDGSIFDGNTGEPFEADIRITDNNEFDVTSFGDSYYMQVLPGVYDIIVSAEGYFVESKTVTVTTGMTTTTDFEMWLGPELSIEKLGPSISSGIIEYTLLVHNAGSLVTDVIITDTVPISTEYVSSSHDGYLDGNVVTWQFEDIDYDETIEVSFVVSVVDELMQAIRSGDLNIVGGGPADPDAYPWMLSLQMNGAGHFCGASLISDEWALTAAHCIEGGYWQPDYVVVGRYDLTTTDGEEIDVVEVIMHEDYGNSANDIGLMRLEHAPESPVPFIPMVTGDNDAVGVWATVIGWGALYSGGPSPDELYEVDVPIISNEDCNTSYPGQISDDMICAGDLENGGIDSCQGDSGGPFIVLDDAGGWEQAGIVSWGQGCAAPGYPGVYARTSYFIDWISETCDGCLSPDNRVFIFNYDYGVLADGLYTATGDPVVTLITDTATIDVNPMDIMAVQDTDSSTVQDLTIANIGNLDLDWEIEEDGAPVRSIIKTADESAAFARTAPAHVGRSAPIYNATDDVILEEGFESGEVPPAGWTVEQFNSNQTWQVTESAYDGTYAAEVLYDDALGEQDEWLLSPEITADSATLSFWSMGSTYWCRDDNDNCDFAIWLVIGDPGDGDDIFVGLAEDSWIENWVWEQSVFDLTSALPDGTFRIGFQYDGQDAAQIGLDNIVLDTSGGSPPPSETIIEEGFEDGLVPPTDWTLEQFNANETWHVTNVSMHDGLYSAEVLYDEALGDQDEWLLSPEITTDSAVLSFWSMGSVYWCRDDNDNCDLAVWLVIGEPGDGDDIFVGLAEDSWTENWVWAESVFDLTSVLPDGTFRIGFQYDGQDAAQVGLDDILLEGAGDPPLPEICEEPSDIPWLSLSATSGTLTGGTETIVGVTLDSTGMDYGFYNANLCVTSNDPDFDLIVVPVDMVVQEPPTIELEKTVGLDPAICADTTEITVLGDTEVYYCYTVENTSDMVLQLHYLDDSELGVIVDDLVYDLAPAESLVMTASAFITETTVNEAIWTASTDMLEGTFILPTPLIATDMASATVIVTDELYDVEIVSDVDMLIGEPNETVTYTLFVTNTGNMPDVYDIALADNVWLTTVDALTLTLDAGVTTTLQVAVTIDVSATNGMTDTVDVTVTSQNDVTVADAVVLTTEAMVEIVEPEYGVEVVSDIDALIGEPGETVTYILSITNTGDVADTFDVTFAGNVWVTDGDADTLTLDAGASDTLNVMVTIDAAANDGDTDIVDVTVTSQNDDTIFDDVTLTTTAEVPAVLIPDINLVKTVGTDPSACGTETFIEVDAGTMVTYCYTVENIGDSILTSHTLVDNQLGALFTDKAFDLAPDETYVYTATAVIDDFTVNMATWFASDDAGNNVSASAQAYVTAIIAGQDLVIEKELNDYPLVNNDVTYWIYYYNNGDTSVDNVITITDILPDNVSYVSSYSYGSATLVATDTNIIWNVPSLSSYEAGYLEVTVMLNGSAGDDLVNVATIETDETDVNPENNIYTDTATIISTLGGISGNVTNASGDPLDHIIINIFVANDDGSQGDFIDWLSTDSNGDYSYNLTTGNYFVAFYDWYDSYYQPEFYDNAKTIFSATVVAVTAGETTTGIDAILEDPAASVASGSADSGYIINDPTTGLLGIWMPLGGETDLTITKTVTCDGDVTPTNVQLILTESDNTATSFSMTMAISDTYVATIPFNQIQNGELSISYDCGGETQTEVIGSITLIDPSGYITDAETGDPIEGAEVQLYKLEGWSPKVDKSDTRPQTCHTTATRDLISSEWENHPPAQTDSGRPANPNADPVEIAPPINPLYTDKDGYYRWDVTEGCWFVKVLKDDYMERISPAVGVTEAYPVTDLNLTLMKVTVPPTQTVPTRNMIYLPIVLKN